MCAHARVCVCVCVQVVPGVVITALYAGHVLGAAQIHINMHGRTILYTGETTVLSCHLHTCGHITAQHIAGAAKACALMA